MIKPLERQILAGRKKKWKFFLQVVQFFAKSSTQKFTGLKKSLLKLPVLRHAVARTMERVVERVCRYASI
jgi:hypothetical protein